ncbi:hypothetical protein MTBUT4_420028 [Magnetospirillum sp. UT-4]|nr:hypothetical protein MTBUT4_420028 [Magnetospirillum sp. UT-4]
MDDEKRQPSPYPRLSRGGGADLCATTALPLTTTKWKGNSVIADTYCSPTVPKPPTAP